MNLSGSASVTRPRESTMTVLANNQNSQITRRSLVRKTGTVAAGWAATAGGSAHPAALESLSLDGGPKAVRYTREQQRAISKWPRFHDQEKEAVLGAARDQQVLRRDPYARGSMPGLSPVPYAKAHCNGHKRAHVDVLRPRSPRGQRDHGAVVHSVSHDRSHAVLRLCPDLRGH